MNNKTPFKNYGFGIIRIWCFKYFVLNCTICLFVCFNNISVISRWCQFYWWRKPEDPEKATCISIKTWPFYIMYSAPYVIGQDTYHHLIEIWNTCPHGIIYKIRTFPIGGIASDSKDRESYRFKVSILFN
jgi:hypothetical protein